MLSKLNGEEIQLRKNSKNYREYEDMDEFIQVNNDIIMESGIALFDKDSNVTSMYKTDSFDETLNTLKKVVAVSYLGEEEIKRMDKIRHIIKGFLKICFRKKFTVFALSMAFIFMFFMGVKERVWAACLMYSFGFFTITETGQALKFIRDSIEDYKLREEALLDREIMDFLNKEIDNDVDDIKVYLMKKNK